MTAATAIPALSVRGATKRFGAVLALDGVDLEVHRGQVLALLGDNGAGKSTLIKCISGVHQLDDGVIEMDGLPTAIHSAAQARDLGIETVYQDLALFDNLGPAANFYAGREAAGPRWLPTWLRVLDRKGMAARTAELLDRLEVGLPDMSSQVGLLSGCQRPSCSTTSSVSTTASSARGRSTSRATAGSRRSSPAPPRHSARRSRSSRRLRRSSPGTGGRPASRSSTGPSSTRGSSCRPSIRAGPSRARRSARAPERPRRCDRALPLPGHVGQGQLRRRRGAALPGARRSGRPVPRLHEHRAVD